MTHQHPADQSNASPEVVNDSPSGTMDHSQMNHGHMASHDHEVMIADFLRRFWVCLILSVPVVALSMMFQDMIGYHVDFPYRNPLVAAISTTIAARKGLLIRNRTAFEESRKITAMVFDKTGTLTEGKFGVTRIKVLATTGMDEAALLQTAAALKQPSQHPIAQGLVREANKRGLALPAVQNFQSITGQGVSALVDGHTVVVVSPGYLTEKHIAIPPDAFGNGAETVVFVLTDGELTGYVALSDTIRGDAKEAVHRLQASGIKVYMATGDNQLVADAVANALGLDGVYAEVLPDQKVTIIKALQVQGQFVA